MMLIKSYIHVHLSDPQEEANLTRITELESQLTRANGLVAHLRKSSDEVKVTGYRGGARTREVFLEPFFVKSSSWLLHVDSLLLADGKHIPVCKHSKFHAPCLNRFSVKTP